MKYFTLNIYSHRKAGVPPTGELTLRHLSFCNSNSQDNSQSGMELKELCHYGLNSVRGLKGAVLAIVIALCINLVLHFM